MQKKGFLLMKPEAIQRNFIGKIFSVLEDKGLKIIGFKMLQPTTEQIYELYKQYQELPHFKRLIECTSDGPVIPVVVSTVGDIDPAELLTQMQGRYNIAGTIRFDLASHISRNVIHCSDDYIVAEKELSIFFKKDEICDYEKVLDQFLID